MITDTKDMIQLTLWRGKQMTVETLHGPVGYEDWLGMERERINTNPDRIAEVRFRGSLVALFADKPKGLRVYRNLKKGQDDGLPRSPRHD